MYKIVKEGGKECRKKEEDEASFQSNGFETSSLPESAMENVSSFEFLLT